MPGPTITLDQRLYRETIARAVSAGALGREAFLRHIGNQSLVMMRADADARAKDTGRFLRGLDMAQNDLGVQRVPLTAIRPAKGHDLAETRLRYQAAAAAREAQRWIHNVQSYEQPGSDYYGWRSYIKAVKIKEEAVEYSRRATEALQIIQEDPSAVVVWGGKAKKAFALRKLARSIGTLYGAAARISTMGGGSVLIVAHKEPHARIVEKRTGIIARGLASFRGSGTSVRKGAAKHYLMRLFPVQAKGAA